MIEDFKEYNHNHYLLNKAFSKFRHRENRHLLKVKNLMHYSNPEGSIVCNNCGEQDIDVLCLDHIEGKGNQHRKEDIKSRGSGLYYWVARNNYPDGFQVLCANCNIRKTRTDVWRNRN